MKMNNGRAMTLPGGVAYGALISFTWTLLAAGFLAWMIHKEMVAETTIGYGSMVILLSGATLGSYAGWKKVMCKRLLASMGVGLLYMVLLLGVTAFFFGGQYQGMAVTGLLILGGSLLSVMIGPGHKRSKQGRLRKIRMQKIVHY